jgi:hypothetical protein
MSAREIGSGFSCTEATDASASAVDDPHLSNVVANSIKFISEFHPLRYVEAETPKIDDVPSFAKR